jgi:hypothetical protein
VIYNTATLSPYHIIIPFLSAEEMFEFMGIEPGKAFAVVDGFTYDNHGGERQVVLFHNLCKVLQLSSIDALVLPGKVVANGNRGGFGIFL